jgi:hypothetical protein
MADLSNISTEELLAMREKASAPAQPSLADIPTEQLLKMRGEAAERERPKASPAESVFRGAAQGASLGFIDEATAGVGAVKDWAAGKLGMRGDISVSDAYGTYINRIRAKDDAAKADNPAAFTAGAVGGGVATAVVPGAIAAKAGQAMNSVKGGVAIGGLTGAGMSEADLSTNEGKNEFLKDVGGGALLGGVATKGFQLLGKGANALRPTELNKLANLKTLKAAGYMGPDLKKLSETQKQEIGEVLYKKGIGQFGQSLDDVVTKTGAAKEEAGQAIGQALDGVDDLVKNAKQMIDEGKIGGNLPPAGKEALKNAVDKQFQFNMTRIGQRIEKELIEPNLLKTKSGDLAPNPNLRGEMVKLQKLATQYRSFVPTSMRQGNVIKGTQGKVSNFDSDTIPNTFKKEVYDIIKTEIDDIVAKTGNLEAAIAKGKGNILGQGDDVAARNDSVSSAFQGAKKDYAALTRSGDVAQSRLGQVQANREISLTDTIAGAAGLASGNPVNALAMGGLNKLARQYGDGAIASGARTAAKIVGSTPKALGEFYPILAAAAQRGGPALNSTHVALMKDPNYQRILAEYEEKQSPMGRRLRKSQRTGE